MTNIKPRILTIWCLMVVFSFIFTVVAIADTQQKLDNANSTLSDLRAQQAHQSSELADMNTQMDSISNKLSDIKSQISDTQGEIDSLKEDSKLLALDIQDQYEAMKLRIKYMYENSASSSIELLFEAKSLPELLTRTEYIYQITQYDNTMMQNLKSDMVQLQTNLDTVEADMEKLQDLKTSASAESNNLKKVIKDLQKKIDINSADIKRWEELALQYEKQLEQERIAALMAQGQGLNSSFVSGGKALPYTTDDLNMLAAIVECEAGNQPYEGRVAVASVVCNRVNNPRFDNTISEVILAPRQFSPVTSGRFAIVLARGACDECRKAALQALNGGINVDALYFIVYRGSKDDNKLKIGDHVFFSDWALY